MNTKSLSNVHIKDAAAGTFSAVFSVFDVVDSDGDVVRKGSFTSGADVVISSYGHTSWRGELPLGKGTIREVGNEAIVDGQFFLDTTHGRDAFYTVKALAESDLQEWSYSLEDVEAETGEVDGQKVRIITKITVKEVSPVLRGANALTRTLAVKGKQAASDVVMQLRALGRERWGDDETYVWVEDWDPDDEWAVFCISDYESERLLRVDFTRDDNTVTLGDTEAEVQRTVNYAPKGAKFVEQTLSVLADVDQLITRATEVVALRAAKGKTLAAESVDALTRLDVSLDRLKAVLVPPPPTPSVTADVEHEFLRYVAQAQGVTLS